jgi:hypothetical protein
MLRKDRTTPRPFSLPGAWRCSMTKKKSYRRYNPEFKREAIKRASEEGVTDAAQKKSD